MPLNLVLDYRMRLNKKPIKTLLFFLQWIVFAILALAFWPLVETHDIPKYWPKPYQTIPALDSNWFKLGRMLFYDTHLSSTQLVSCASCHQSATAFAHVDHPLSHGVYDRTGKRNAPALFNLAWNKAFMWDGRAEHLKVQTRIPIEHPDEMDMSMQKVLSYINQAAFYKKQIFNCTSTYTLNESDVLHAFEVFVLHIISSQSKYDRVKAGKAQFNSNELAGYKIYKTYCAECHTEPLMSRGDFSNNKLSVNMNKPDYGRFEITLHKKDSMRFKIPTLRNLSYSFPYMHDGRFANLRQVLQHYRLGAGKHLFKIKPYSLEEENYLMAFLLALNDSVFIRNPAYKVPREFFNQ